jgi:hypothetical protein
MDRSHTRPKIDYSRLKELLNTPSVIQDIREAVVNTPFNDKVNAAFLGLGIVVLLLKNNQTNDIERVALSKTEQAAGAVRMSAKPFKDIIIPADYEENFIAKCILTGRPQQTDDWQYLFIPGLTAEEARFNQAGAGISCSFIYPLKKTGGAMIFSYFANLSEMGETQKEFMKKYSELADAALSRSS